MHNLILFAYISTAFSQFYRDKIEEKFYPPPCDPDDMIRLAEHFDKLQAEELIILTDSLLRPWMNTYVFTKALSEEVVRRVAHKFPVIVVRPSIIISTYEDPVPGWANNFHGLNGFLVGTLLGFVKLFPGSKNSRDIEVVCGDFVTNGTLAAIWDKSKDILTSQTEICTPGGLESPAKFDESRSIVHITCQNPVSRGDIQDLIVSWIGLYPSNQCFSFPSLTYVEPGLMYFMMALLHHVIPAIILDVFFTVTNNKSRLLPSYRKFEDFVSKSAYFANQIWVFDNNNLKRIVANMSETDQRFFHCDVFKFDLLSYSLTYHLGLRTYVAKEPLENLSTAKRRLRMLRYVSYVTSTFYYSFLGCVLYLFLNVTGVAYYLNVMCGKLYELLKLQ